MKSKALPRCQPVNSAVRSSSRSGRSVASLEIIGLALLLSHNLSAQTFVNRTGASGAVQDVTLANTTWSASGSPYILEGQLTVGRGATLTVQPGVTVQVQAGKGIFVDGTLAANGATFTIKDSGNWRGIYLSADAGASVLSDCTIRAAGADNLGYIHFAYRRAAVYVDSCSPTISNCRFENNAAHGIELYSSRATIRGNSFINVGDGSYAIVFDATDNWPVLSGNSASGAGILGISVPRGNLTGTNAWFKPGANFPYFLNDEVTLVEGARLALEAGVALKTDAQRFVINGTLKAMGTAADPILFTSRAATPAPGNWKGLYFGPSAGDSELAYCTVSYAGRDNIGYIHFGNRFAAIYVDGCNPRFSQVTVDQSQWTGFELYGASPRIENSSILNCGAHALRAEAGSRPIVSDLVINGNGKSGDGYFAVALEATAVPQPTRVSFANNRLQGVQIWGGTLDTNALWRNWNSQAPYVVTANTTVGDKVNLTIESGTVVKFQNSGLFVKGVLQADGAAAPIQFTSWRDDTVGGDSNGDGSATSGKDGIWRGLYLSPASGSSVLNNVTFRYGGMDSMDYIHFAYRRTELYVDSCAAKITNCRFLDSAAHGLELYDAPATVQNNVFQNLGDGWYAIAYDTLNVFPTIAGNSASGTGTLGVYLPGGTIAGTNTWNKPGVNFPYFLNGELTLKEDAVLMLDPGVTCKSEGQRVLVSGSLLAKGTAADPVVFTSRKPDPAPGDWPGIYFAPTAGKSDLAYTTLAFAGRDSLGYFRFANRQTAIFVDASNPRFDHLTITNSQFNALELYAASPTITGSAVVDCGRHGLRAEAGSRPSVVDTRFTGNGTKDNGYHVVALGANAVPSPSNVQFANNKLQGVQIWGGTLAQDALWKNWNPAAPYVVTDNTTIGDGVHLTIEPGAIVKFQNSSLSIRGVLTADGTADRIGFTSWRDDVAGGDSNGDGNQTKPDPGNWKGLYLSLASGASAFTNCTFRYAGGDNLGYINFGYRFTTLYLDGSSPSISRCAISDSANHGIELFGSAATLRDNVFSNFGNTGYAVVLGNLESFPVASGNIASGTGNLGVWVGAGTLSKAGRWTKPGTNFPYLLQGDLTIATGTALSLAPGVTVKTREGIYVNGTLDARGSPSEPIVFTSNRPTPAPGDWKGIYFGPQSGNSVLRHSSLSYAGRDNLGYFNFGYRFTTIYIENARPDLSGVIISQSGAQGIMLYNSMATLNNSLIYSNRNSGIALMERAAPQLVNNTIVRNSNSGIDGGNGAPVVVNNIIAFNGADGISSSAGAPVLRNNCVFGNTRTNYSGLVPGAQDLSADPQFVNANQGNYRLAAGSPAVNAGDNSVVLAGWNDLDGLIRVQAGRVDLGAFEFGSAAAPVIVLSPKSQAVLTGANASFTVTASGTGPLGYQWRKNGNTISGATNATLTLNNVQTADAGDYTVVVSNAAGSVTSSAATLTVSIGDCAPPVAGLIGWWPGDGSFANLVATNSGVPLGKVSFAAGQVSQGFSFASDGDGITIPHDPIFDVQTPGFTAEFWMKGSKNQPQNLCLLVEKSHGWVDSTGWAFQGFSDSGKISFGVGAGGAGSTDFVGVTSSTDVLDGAFHHVAGTWDGSKVRLYLDRTLQGEGTLSAPVNNSRPVNVGYSWGGGSANRFFRGQVDELSIYRRALSSNEVAAIFAAGSAGKCKSTASVPVITSALTASGQVGVAFSYQIIASNNPTNYAATGLPAGLSVNPATGLISGTPAVAGTNTVTLSAANAGGTTTKTLTLIIAPQQPPQPPVIVLSPQGQTVLPGGNVTFTVTASGSEPLAYQWRKEGNLISGATQATLTLNNVQATDAGNYTVAVSNAAGSVTSGPTTLTVSGSTVIPPANLPRLTISMVDNRMKVDYWLQNTQGLMTLLQSDAIENLTPKGLSLYSGQIPASRQGSLLLTNWQATPIQFFVLREQASATNATPPPAANIQTTPIFSKSIQPSATSQTIDCGEQVRVTIPPGVLSSPQPLNVGTAPPNPSLRAPLGLISGKIYELTLGDLESFDAPLTVEIPYDPSLVNPDLPITNAVTVAYWSPEQNLWSVQPSVVDAPRQVLIFQTYHLSPWEPVYIARGYEVWESETHRFKVVAKPGVGGTLGAITYPASAFLFLVTAQLESAYSIYTNSFARPITPIWVFLDASINEAEWTGICGDIWVPMNFKSANELKVTLGHELFHAVQNRYYNVGAAGAGYRKWWHEACAQYAGQVLVAGNAPPFDSNLYLTVDFLATPLTTANKIHEYATANFLDFLFRESNGKVTFKGQFDALESFSFSLGGSLLSRLDNHVKAQTGQTLQDFYRRFAADFAFNEKGYAPGQDPWGPAAGGLSSRIEKMGPEVIEKTVPLQLPPEYTALLYAIKVETLPGKAEGEFRIRVKDPDPRVVLDVFRLPALRQSSRPSPFLTSILWKAQTGNLELAHPALKNGEYLAFVGSNTRTDAGANITFTIDRVNFTDLKVTITGRKLGDYEWEFQAAVEGGYPPYEFDWYCMSDPRVSWNQKGPFAGTTNPVLMTGDQNLTPLGSKVTVSVTVVDSHLNRGSAVLTF